MGGADYHISMSRWVNRSADEGFRVMDDIESFPEFMPNVVSIELLEESQDRKVAAWEINLDDAPMNWIEEGIYDRGNRLIRFRSLEGVFDRFDGFWKIEEENGGSRISFELVYQLGLPEIEQIVAPLLRTRLIENAESMLQAIEQRMEGGR